VPQEHFIVLLLDTKNRFMAHRIVSRGTLDSSAAHPREVFKEAIRESASAVILMHNHPSGDPEPSPEDRSVTRQLVEAGAILGIRVLDHLILGRGRYYSFRDGGEM
jgi:DNA repair protein RadC